MIPKLPPDALQVWEVREDLQAAFDIKADQGREGLFWWYFCRGRRELPVSLEVDSATIAFLNAPQEGVEQHSFLPITRLMYQLWRQAAPRPGDFRNRRRKLQLPKRFTARKEREDQEVVLAWYFLREVVDANLEPLLTHEQAQGLIQTDPHGVTTFEKLIWNHDPHQHFVSVEHSGYREWVRSDGSRKYRLLSHPKIALATEARIPARPLSGGSRPFGVNLYGHAGARSGVGEDVRMAALALRAADVPFTLHSVKAGELPEEEAVQPDPITDDYAINLFCMTGLETFTLAQQRGRGLLDGHYNIGFWPWELPEWPAAFDGCFELVDEVWSASRFTAQALAGSAPVFVRHLPMAVVANATEGLSRNDFDLPEDSFLFGFALDGNSGFERKNPLACLRAFRSAFHPDERVGLVIKGQRVEGLPGWTELEQAASADGRIQLRTGSYSRGRLLDLYRNLDVFVSLHRSEGFGRNIAEAMLVGTPAMVTDYSGNRDFTTPETSILIKAAEVTVRNNEYRFGSGMAWAEPDIECAAQAMVMLRDQQTLRLRLSESAQQSISEMFDPAAVGCKYRLVLEQIFAEGSPN